MARVEQEERLALPPGAEICSLAFTFPSRPIRYDDNLLVTANDILLMSSPDYTSSLAEAEPGLFRYDWDAIRGGSVTSYPASPYCIGGSDSCVVPATETIGAFRLKVDDERAQAIAARTPGTLTFKLVTTGDNNPERDCAHSAITFDVTAAYVVRQ
jgi:hypothetical protein